MGDTVQLHPHQEGAALQRIKNYAGFGERRRPEEAAGGDPERKGEDGEAAKRGGEEKARVREAARIEMNLCPCRLQCLHLPHPPSSQPKQQSREESARQTTRKNKSSPSPPSVEVLH